MIDSGIQRTIDDADNLPHNDQKYGFSNDSLYVGQKPHGEIGNDFLLYISRVEIKWWKEEGKLVDQ